MRCKLNAWTSRETVQCGLRELILTSYGAEVDENIICTMTNVGSVVSAACYDQINLHKDMKQNARCMAFAMNFAFLQQFPEERTMSVAIMAFSYGCIGS